MRFLIFVLFAATACGPRVVAESAAPRYAPGETVILRVPPSEAVRRVVAVYTADGIPVERTEGSIITTAPVHSIALASGSARGSVIYFYRATVTGDSTSTVSLALWGRFITRAGAGPESPARETPISVTCETTPACAAQLARMRAHAEKLRGP